MEIPPEVGSNTVRLRYIGPMQGSFRAHGFATGARYFIDGRGDTIIVDVRDVDGLMQRHTGGRPDFERIEDVQQQAVSQFVEMPAVKLDDPPSNLPSITDLNAKDGINLIQGTDNALDLQVWLAEERASETPRKTVIAALEERIQDVQANA